MTGEVIKSFLVSLGFGVDDNTLGKFNKAIASAGVRVAALYAGVQAAASGIFYAISNISQGFEDMGYEMRIIAPAINKALMLRNAMLAAYKAAGVNITKVVQESVKFNFSLAKTKFALEALYKSVGARFIPLLTKQMDIFRNKIYANMPRIQAGLEKFVKFIFKAFEATYQLGQRIWSILERVYGFFERLHNSTDGWSTVVFGLIAAWKLLNLSFLATPIGMVLAGLTALLTLYDDFKTQQEGGESLFNWLPYLPAINKIIDAFYEVKKVIESIFDTIGFLVLAFNDLFHLDFRLFGDRLVQAFKSVIDIFDHIKNTIYDLVGSVGSAFSGYQGVNPYMDQQAFVNKPLGSGGSGGAGGNTQSINQNNTTSIIVNGGSDPQATGNAVLSGQGRAHADFGKNLKGAAR